jgi:hypothetical protein
MVDLAMFLRCRYVVGQVLSEVAEMGLGLVQPLHQVLLLLLLLHCAHPTWRCGAGLGLLFVC